MPDAPPLAVGRLDAYHGDVQAPFGVSLTFAGGGVVAVIGAPGDVMRGPRVAEIYMGIEADA